ncbi:MAG: pyrophosphate--fructose-6-phosphate 1-phosphotransferase [Candidatus Marinimicrobia bacterium]|nr:pyrophosphate--fructose-6-phosphate 1-phosphotransferase [Candidatus Neomarinimicrobiota bacterium]|tara:strand:+ start:8479 stop:9663 length:1185 start_codon:yes stop_codon:yes gene_type:complete
MRVAFLTAGGIAPCLSASIGALIKEYLKSDENFDFIGYLNGYKGLLKGNKIEIPKDVDFRKLNTFGGSFLGNSRVKLTNVDDCVKNNYINSGEIPLQVAANQLKKDKVDILHTIGGDDTNTTAGDLVKFLSSENYKLAVVGLPKTIDNDVTPIEQTLGAYTAAEHTAIFFRNIVNENTTSYRQLIIHEVMGRNCGWLTAYSAYLYRQSLNHKNFIPELQIHQNKWDVHAVYIPELEFDLDLEVKRLNKVMDKFDCVNIFLSEGAGLDNIISEKTNNGEQIPKDAFGHVRLDEINPGQWFAQYFKGKLNCDKVLVQKSGYFARSASPNDLDLKLIEDSASIAVDSALLQNSGVAGLRNDTKTIELIDFNEIKGGKKFNPSTKWFQKMLKEIKATY